MRCTRLSKGRTPAMRSAIVCRRGALRTAPRRGTTAIAMARSRAPREQEKRQAANAACLVPRTLLAPSPRFRSVSPPASSERAVKGHSPPQRRRDARESGNRVPPAPHAAHAECGWRRTTKARRRQRNDRSTLGSLDGGLAGGWSRPRARSFPVDPTKRSSGSDRRSARCGAAASRIWGRMVARSSSAVEQWPAVIVAAHAGAILDGAASTIAAAGPLRRCATTASEAGSPTGDTSDAWSQPALAPARPWSVTVRRRHRHRQRHRLCHRLCHRRCHRAEHPTAASTASWWLRITTA